DAPQVPHMTYFAWEKSPFATGNRATAVDCEDCHMARRPTGQQVNEWAPMVPWGPSRPRARSHLLLGGNVLAGQSLGDPRLAEAEHELNMGVMSVAVPRAERIGDVMRVTITV